MAITLVNRAAVDGDAQAGQLIDAIEDKAGGLHDIVVRLAGLLYGYRGRQDVGGSAERRAGALEDIAQLQSGAAAVHQGMMLLIEDALHAGVPSPGTTSDALIEDNLRSAWAAARAELDGARDQQRLAETIERLATAAAARADSTMLQALRGQLPQYLTGRGAEGLIARVRTRIDVIEAPYLAPAMRAAALARAVLETGWPRVLAAFDLARGEVSGMSAGARELPDIYPGHTVAVAPAPAATTAPRL